MEIPARNQVGERVARVFMSYRRSDSERAGRLQDASDAVPGLEVYAFPYDEPPSEDWREICRRLIRSADAVVCLVGPTTAQSDNVAWELDQATALGIPVLLAGSGATALANQRGDSRVAAVEDAVPGEILARLESLG